MTDDPDDDKLALLNLGELERAEHDDLERGIGGAGLRGGLAALAAADPMTGLAVAGVTTAIDVIGAVFGKGKGERAQKFRQERFQRALKAELKRIEALLEEQGEALADHEEKLARLSTFIHEMAGPAFMATDELKVKWIARAIANATMLEGVKASGAAALVRTVGEMEPFDLRVMEALVSEGQAIHVSKLAEQLKVPRTYVATCIARMAKHHLVTLNIVSADLDRHDKLVDANARATEASAEIVELCTSERFRRE